MEIFQLKQSAALLVLVLMGIGIMFGLVRLRSVGAFLLALILTPFLFSFVKRAFDAGFTGRLSWIGWLIVIGGVLIIFRLLLSRIFRR